MVEAIFFDLYETLITEFDPNWKPVPSLAEMLGIDEEICLAEWNARYRDSMTGVIPNFSSMLREVCQAANQPVDEKMIEQLYQERLEIKAVPFRQIEDDVIQALEHIRDKGIKTGLITNVRPEEGAAWEGCRLSPLFDEVVFSCKVGSVKPEPQIYHIACSNLGVTPKQSLFNV